MRLFDEQSSSDHPVLKTQMLKKVVYLRDVLHGLYTPLDRKLVEENERFFRMITATLHFDIY